ncbi:MAG: TRIC cation channel family protein, partial [Methanomassiliicoccales archaeon]
NPIAAVLLGIITAVGGGMTRDVLVREIPAVLRTEIYAVAALLGSSVVVIGSLLNVPSYIDAVLGALLCFLLRLLSMHFKWQLPTAKVSD